MNAAWNLFLDPERQTPSDELQGLMDTPLVVLSNTELKEFPLSLHSRLFIIEVPGLDNKTFSDVFDKKLQDSFRGLQESLGLSQKTNREKLQRRSTKARTMDHDLALSTMQTAMAAVSALKEDIISRNKDTRTRQIQKTMQLLVDHMFVEKLIAGEANHEVAEEEIQALLDLAFSDKMGCQKFEAVEDGD
jgi:hypothetical protein